MVYFDKTTDMKKKYPLLTLLICVSVLINLNGQKKVRVEFEKIQEQCKGLSLDKKVRLAVSRFSVTTTNRGGDFGQNMATMLTNALQETSCFRVLEQINNLEDMTKEIQFAQSENADGETGPDKGKMMSAQVVVTGEITEYSIQKKEINILIGKTGTNIAKIGFIVKILNPQTREILFSKSINVEGKTAGKTRVGVKVPIFGSIDAGSGSNEDPAVANALEKGIIEAVEFLSAKKDEIPLPSITNNIEKATTVMLTGADFSTLNSLTEIIKNISQVKDVQKSLKDGIGILKIRHNGNTESLVDELSKKMPSTLQITDFADGKITLKSK